MAAYNQCVSSLQSGALANRAKRGTVCSGDLLFMSLSGGIPAKHLDSDKRILDPLYALKG